MVEGCWRPRYERLTSVEEKVGRPRRRYVAKMNGRLEGLQISSSGRMNQKLFFFVWPLRKIAEIYAELLPFSFPLLTLLQNSTEIQSMFTGVTEMERTDDVVDLGGDGDDDQGCDSKEKGHGCWKNCRKAKKVAIFGFRKVDKQLRRKNKKASLSPPPYSSTGCFSRRVGGGRRDTCYTCFKQTPTLDSSVESSQTSDPNSAEFGFEKLRALMETNDFYSKECNPHLDTDGTSQA
ncbi:hypothetical protein NMG60_11036332 [Bertholletia excelsa]